MLTDADPAYISDALVDQKNLILALISETGDDIDSLEQAKALLNFAAPLWEALGYQYKVTEVAERIARAASLMLAREEAFLGLLRKNASARVSIVRGIDRLKALAGV